MASIDVSVLAADVASQAAPVGLVGVACLLVYLAIRAFAWIRQCLDDGSGDDEYERQLRKQAASDAWERNGGRD